MGAASRRSFMKQSVASGVTAAITVTSSPVSGANDQLRAAVVGLRGRDGILMNGFHDVAGTRVVAICDCG